MISLRIKRMAHPFIFSQNFKSYFNSNLKPYT